MGETPFDAAENPQQQQQQQQPQQYNLHDTAFHFVRVRFAQVGEMVVGQVQFRVVQVHKT